MRSACSLYSQPMFPFFISILTAQFTPVLQQCQGLIFHGMKLFSLHLLANGALLFLWVDRLFLPRMPWLCLESFFRQCTGQFVSYYPVPQSSLMFFPRWRRLFRKKCSQSHLSCDWVIIYNPYCYLVICGCCKANSKLGGKSLKYVSIASV